MPWRCDLSRQAQVARKSKETQLTAKVLLEGRGRVQVSSGLPFLDHMLEQVARYGGFDPTLRGGGGVQVDPHPLLEDARLALRPVLCRAPRGPEGLRRVSPRHPPLDH